MLFRKSTWPGLADGSITRAFRWWKRPTVKVGGTLRTPVGVIAIDSVAIIDPGAITARDARAAGFASPDALRAELDGLEHDDRQMYRIAFHQTGEDPRAELRSRTDLTDDEIDAIAARLDRLDRAADPAWTRATLDLIATQPAVAARILAEQLGTERLETKARIRKLKALGLTESLPVGYRLSPRGEAVRARLAK